MAIRPVPEGGDDRVDPQDLPHLDERRRLVLGAEARWLGHGGSGWSRRRRGVEQDGVGGGG
jgi:hypothetical protein